MARIIVHLADTGDDPRNPVLNCARFRPGDIVTIKPDNAVLSRKTLGAHNRLVELPNIQTWEIEHLIGKDFPATPDGECYARGRVWTFIDINSVPATFEGEYEDLIALMKVRPRVAME